MHAEIWKNRLKAVAVGLGLALSALTARHWYGTFRNGHPPCADCLADFPGFYAAAKLIWENPSGLYDYGNQHAIQSAIDSRIGEAILPFAYPPFTAVVLMPLGWIPFPWAFLAMTVVNAFVLALTLFMLIRNLGLRQEQSLWLLLSTFCNFGVHGAFLQGQTSFVTLFCLTAFMFAVSRRRDQLSVGGWAGAVFFKPQYLLVPLLTLVCQRLWKGLWIAVTILIVLCAGSLMLVGQRGIGEYLRLLEFYGTSESGFGSYPGDMHNLRSLVQYLVPFSYAPYLWVALMVVVAALTIWLNTKKDHDARMTDSLWIANFLAMILLAPHVYAHDLSLMLVPSALLLRRYAASVPLSVAALLIGLCVLPILPHLIGDHTPPILSVIFLLALIGCAKVIQPSNKAAVLLS